MQTEYTGTRSTAEGGVGTSPNTPELPPANLLPLDSRSPPRSPLLSLQFMPPPPNPPRVDEDETMDIVPDSEPSRIADGPTPSVYPVGPADRVPTLVESDHEIVPESSGETDDSGFAQGDTDRVVQGEKMQETEPETEQDDDPMDGDQLLVNQRRKRPPKPILEEEQEDQRVEQVVHDDATVPRTEDEVPLAAPTKLPKPSPEPLPPRGRSTRNKRPIIYTESPGTSENEASTMKLCPILVILKYVSGRGRNRRNPCRSSNQKEESRKGGESRGGWHPYRNSWSREKGQATCIRQSRQERRQGFRYENETPKGAGKRKEDIR